jgi:thiol-disulfide isomerase/thioredoxin
MKKFSRLFIFSVICAVLFISFPAHVNAQVSPDTARLLRNVNIQVLAHPMNPRDFTLQFLDGGSAVLSSYKDKVVILNFWATWCPPCRAEMPSMETFYRRYKEQGLEILAVDLREDANTVRQFVRNNGYNFPVLLDINGKAGSSYGVEAIPTTYIINREGKIIGRIVGSISWDTPQVFTAFDALLSGR